MEDILISCGCMLLFTNKLKCKHVSDGLVLGSGLMVISITSILKSIIPL